MIRTTEEASGMHVTVYGLNGKVKETYEIHPPQAAFFDMCNQLDHCRNAGLAAVVPPEKNRHVKVPA